MVHIICHSLDVSVFNISRDLIIYFSTGKPANAIHWMVYSSPLIGNATCHSPSSHMSVSWLLILF